MNIGSIKQKKGGQLAAFFVFVFVTSIILPGSFLRAQNDQIGILSYNVENLFDTINNPTKMDEEFTPLGKLGYNSSRYHQKITNISRVINAADDSLDVQIIGLCEVENRAVLDNLKSKLKNSHFEIVHFDSPDNRGIDNALFYDNTVFKFIESKAIPVELGANYRPTRDILMVRLLENESQQEFAVFVNHWPSRIGGEEKSRPKRMTASRALEQSIQQIKNQNPATIIIVMGDFNDQPSDKSLLALTDCKKGVCLKNMQAQFVNTDQGSCAYRGKWEVLDQILIGLPSSSKTNWSSSELNAGFIRYKWMMFTNAQYQTVSPSRFFGSTSCYGGYSDHLPAYLILKKQ